MRFISVCAGTIIRPGNWNGEDMTPFGSKLRAMRAARGVTLKEMAQFVGVSAAYISALEHGRRGTPSWYLVQRIIAYFNVIWDEAEELARLAQISDPRITLDTAGLSPEATELANHLARDIAHLTPEEIAQLLALLKKRGKPSESRDLTSRAS